MIEGPVRNSNLGDAGAENRPPADFLPPIPDETRVDEKTYIVCASTNSNYSRVRGRRYCRRLTYRVVMLS